MSDTSIQKITQYGTQAARIAFVPSPPVGVKTLYLWYEIDNPPDLYAWNGAAWVKVNASGGGSGLNQLTGDVTAGPGTGSQVATLANSGVVSGTYTNATVTVDAKGRVTIASSGAAPPTPTTPGETWLATRNAAVSAALDFTSIINSTYDVYKFVFRNVLPSISSNDFELYFSIDNGATWVASNYYYSWWYTNNVGGGSIQAAGPVNRGLICNAVVTTDNEGVNGFLHVYNPLGSQTRKSFNYQVYAPLPGDHRQFWGGCTNLTVAGNPVNAVRFRFASGNVASGSIYCYGLTK